MATIGSGFERHGRTPGHRRATRTASSYPSRCAGGPCNKVHVDRTISGKMIWEQGLGNCCLFTARLGRKGPSSRCTLVCGKAAHVYRDFNLASDAPSGKFATKAQRLASHLTRSVHRNRSRSCWNIRTTSSAMTRMEEFFRSRLRVSRNTSLLAGTTPRSQTCNTGSARPI